MTCAEWTVELVECARRRWEPGRELGAHLAGCGRCGERWEAERQLTDRMRTMRARGIALTGEDTQREALMRDFAALHRWKPVRQWVFALSGAAAVFVAILAGHIAGTRLHPASAPTIRNHSTRNGTWNGTREAQPLLYEASADASALSSDDFIAVPYTPPLAQGELVRVVQTDLYPEALASMGIDVDPAWGSDIPAEVVLGEDGIPRAVRITGNAQ